jgi:hypothetical protein
MSYSRDSKSSDPDVRIADFNHFVIFDPRNLLACHDYKYIGGGWKGVFWGVGGGVLEGVLKGG